MLRWNTVVPLLMTFLFGCATSNSNRDESAENRESLSGAESNMPSRMAVEGTIVPAAIRAIESEIDKNAVILADRIDVYVSKNYQLDVSLIGDVVSKDMDLGAANERHAIGKSVAFVRNLQLRADQGIRVRVASTGTQPFLKIRALGHCSHIIANNTTAAEDVKRSAMVTIENEHVRYYEKGEIPVHWLSEAIDATSR